MTRTFRINIEARIKHRLKKTRIGKFLSKPNEVLFRKLPYRFVGLVRFPVSRSRRILFFPDLPAIGTSAYKIALVNRYAITNSAADEVDLLVFWRDATFKSLPEDLKGRACVVNVGCTDISKHYLDECHLAVFGYQLAIDPRTYSGPGVVKSNHNAQHDGVIVAFPLARAEDGFVYQRLINNLTSEGLHEDIRVVIVKNRIPVVYLKYRYPQDRFNHYIKDMTKVVSALDVLSSDEMELIERLCRRIGLEFGELDALRDRDTGQLFIVDANDTPTGPPVGLPVLQHWRTVMNLARTFDDVLFS